MKAVLEARGDTDRTVCAADSFACLPSTERADDDGLLHEDQTLAVSEDPVAASFQRYGLLDDRVIFVKGWFEDTLTGLSDRSWSVVRLDGDMYKSTMDGLINLYPGLAPGGVDCGRLRTYSSRHRQPTSTARNAKLMNPWSRSTAQAFIGGGPSSHEAWRQVSATHQG